MPAKDRTAMDEGYKAYGERKLNDANPYLNIDPLKSLDWSYGWYNHRQMSIEAGGPFPIIEECTYDSESYC